jgi:hypothetical protein
MLLKQTEDRFDLNILPAPCEWRVVWKVLVFILLLSLTINTLS